MVETPIGVGLDDQRANLAVTDHISTAHDRPMGLWDLELCLDALWMLLTILVVYILVSHGSGDDAAVQVFVRSTQHANIKPVSQPRHNDHIHLSHYNGVKYISNSVLKKKVSLRICYSFLFPNIFIFG
jgi:hypothetical protein